MSIEALTVALQADVGNSTRKLILIGYANHADREGRGAFPGIRTVASYANCDKRTAQRHVAALVASGHMREGDQRFVAHLPAHERPLVYDLAMDAETIGAWSAGGGSGRRDALAAVGATGGAKGAPVRWGKDVPRDTSVTPPGDNLSRGRERPDDGVPGDIPVPAPVTELCHPPGDKAMSPKPSVEPTEEPTTEVPTQPASISAEPAGEQAGGLGGIASPVPVDLDALDLHDFVLRCFRLANRGMCDNPAIEGEALEPLRHSGQTSSAAGYQAVCDWVVAGHPRAVIAAAVYHKAKAFKPSADNPQIRSMAYFGRTVAKAAERYAAGMLSVPDTPVPGTQADFVLADRRNETPGRYRSGGGGDPSPAAAAISPKILQQRRDAEVADAWLDANPLEAMQMRDEETAAVRSEPGMAKREGERVFVAMVEQRVRQRVLNRMPVAGDEGRGDA